MGVDADQEKQAMLRQMVCVFAGLMRMPTDSVRLVSCVGPWGVLGRKSASRAAAVLVDELIVCQGPLQYNNRPLPTMTYVVIDLRRLGAQASHDPSHDRVWLRPPVTT